MIPAKSVLLLKMRTGQAVSRKCRQNSDPLGRGQPEREGLMDTPARVVRSYEEFFAGYRENAADMLARTFEEVEGYSDLVLLRNIRIESYCEHHIVPILGVAHIAYLPDRRVVGISKLARVIDIFSKRMQTQETMTAQITDTIQSVLQPARGAACRCHPSMHDNPWGA